MKLRVLKKHTLFLFLIVFVTGVTFTTLFALNQRRDDRSQAFKSESETFLPPPLPSPSSEVLIEEVLEANKKIEQELNKDVTNTSKLEEHIEERKVAVKELMETDPIAVLEQVPEVESLEPQLPIELQKEIEKKTEIKGQIDIIHSDNFQSQTFKNTYTVTSEDGTTTQLHFANDQPVYKSGTEVQAEGVQLDDQMVIIDSTKIEVLSDPPDILGATTAHKTAVILLNFTNDTRQLFTKDEIRQVMYQNTDHSGANAFFQENSQQKFKFEGHLQSEGDIFGWYTVPFTSSLCNASDWAQPAEEMAQEQGFNRDNYKTIIYVFPPIFQCKYMGAATIQSTPGQVWMNGNFNPDVLNHEIGHTLGNYHANGYNCYNDDSHRVNISTNCKTHEYKDPFDVMGITENFHHFNAYHKANSNFLGSSNSQVVTSSGEYTIEPIEKNTSSPTVLIIPSQHKSPHDSTLYYYLEYRQPFGIFDNFFGSDPIVNGILIHLAPGNKELDSTQLIDSTPETESFDDASLLVGKTFTDLAEGISITTSRVDKNSATVQITLGEKKCVRMKPILEFAQSGSLNGPSPIWQSPSEFWRAPGELVAPLLFIKNVDSSACGSSTFTLNTQEGDGFTVNSPSQSFTLDPGKGYSPQIEMTANPTISGDYQFSINLQQEGRQVHQLEGSLHISPLNISGQPPVCPTLAPSCETGIYSAVTPGVCKVYYCGPTQSPVCETFNGKKADFNKDGKVNLTDYAILVREFLKTLDVYKADANCDGKVNLNDYAILVKEFLK